MKNPKKNNGRSANFFTKTEVGSTPLQHIENKEKKHP